MRCGTGKAICVVLESHLLSFGTIRSRLVHVFFSVLFYRLFACFSLCFKFSSVCLLTISHCIRKIISLNKYLFGIVRMINLLTVADRRSNKCESTMTMIIAIHYTLFPIHKNLISFLWITQHFDRISISIFSIFTISWCRCVTI